MSAKAYLAAASLGALNTLNAYKPVARTGAVSLPSFFSGWLTSELAPQSIALHTALSTYFASRGTLKRPAGKVALGLSAASVAGLMAIQHLAEESDDILEEALIDTLGAPHGRHLERVDPPVQLAQVMWPFKPVRKRYVTEADISYGDAGKRNLLDVWARDDLPRDANAPVLLQIHGGAWMIGNKEEQAAPLMSYLAEKGWVCVAINYRLSPRAKWPDHLVDVKRAIAWIRSNIADYGGDPNFIAVTGGSAGGHLTSLAALTPNEPRFQPGFEDVDTSVKAAVPFYGVYDFTNRDGTGRADMEDMLATRVMGVPQADDADLWSSASPMSWINEDAPPFFVIHGTNDGLAPVEQARSFVAMLRDRSQAPVAYAELPGTQHAFDVFTSVRSVHSARAVGRFLNHVRLASEPPLTRA